MGIGRRSWLSRSTGVICMMEMSVLLECFDVF